ncbi:DsbA family protein [Leucobacter sp. GX24907]
MSQESNKRPTKSQRRDAAREQARLAREAEQRREKRGRLLLQGGVVLGVLAILAVVGLVLMQTLKPAGPGPENMVSGGVVFGQDLEVVKTPALQADEEREAPAVDRTKPPLDVTIYVDYMCPACGSFEQTYGNMLENYVGSGDITLQVYPLNFLDPRSNGTKYSSRAANLFSCVVEEQPESAFNLHKHLLSAEVQPTEGTSGYTDDELIEQAVAAGAEGTDELKQCVKDRRFGPFVTANTKQVLEVNVLGLEEGAQLTDPSTGQLIPEDQPQRLSSTPLVIVNGQQWVSTRDGDLEPHLLKLLSQLSGDDKGAADEKSGDSGDAGSADESDSSEESE